MRALAILLLVTTLPCYAAELEVSEKAGDKIKAFTGVEVVLTDKDITDLKTKGFRKRREGEFPAYGHKHKPADAVDLFDRGTVEHAPGVWRNYSHHKVLIPDGTTVQGGNFTQNEPLTEAIVRSPGFGHDLTFIEANLSNNQIYPDWTLVRCQTMQFWLMESSDPNAADGKREDPVPIANRAEDLHSKPAAPAKAVLRKKLPEEVMQEAILEAVIE